MPGFHFIERAYRTAIAANRALLRASSEAEFATEICRIAVEEAGYALAWVGYAEHDARKSVRPCAQDGFDDGYVGLAAVTWDESERGQGPTGTAIRTGKPLLVAGKSPVKPTRFALDGALRDLEPALRRACGSRVTLRVELGAGAACVSMDLRALAQIVTNLVVNARDALGSGGSVGVATTVVELSHPMTRQHAGLSPGRYASIRVADTGTGIAPEVLARVFEPFFTTKGERGTGLGLASALGSAHQAGGGIAVDTAVGKGTTFEVLLPLAQSLLAEELRPSP